MISNSRFDLTRFSLNAESYEIEVRETFTAQLRSVSGVAIEVTASGFFHDTFSGAARGTIAVNYAANMGGALFADVSMRANIISGVFCAEDLTAAAFVVKNLPAALEQGEALFASSYGSKNTPAALAAAEALSARPYASKNIIVAAILSDALIVLTEATSHTTETATFDLSIPPGGELRIDSDLFTVFLDGENALYAQTGAWVILTRKLLRLNIESATGGELTGQIIYTERYL